MATQTVTVTRPPASSAAHSTGSPAPAAIDYSLTDLDLLDTPLPRRGGSGQAEAAAEVAGDSAEAASASGAEPGKGSKGAGDIDGQSRDGERASENEPLGEFAPAFELPDIGPKLQEICERDAEYRAVFPTVSDARAVREVFSTPDAARAAATAQADLARLDRLVESRDPHAHAELLAGLQRLSPQAFRDLALVFAQQLGSLDPEAHRQVSAVFATQGAPASSQSPSSVGARHVVPLQEGAAPAQPDPGVLPASANQFLSAVNAGAEQAVQASVASKVAELVPDAPEGARQKIAGEIFRELDQTLRQDPELLDEVRESVRVALRSGPANFGEKVADPRPERIAQLIATRARAALPAVARRVVADWTETVLRSSRERRSRQTEAASRVEVGRGGAPGPVPLGRRGVDYTRMSDEEILNME